MFFVNTTRHYFNKQANSHERTFCKQLNFRVANGTNIHGLSTAKSPGGQEPSVTGNFFRQLGSFYTNRLLGEKQVYARHISSFKLQLKISNFNKNVYIIHLLSTIKLFSEDNAEKKVDRSTLANPPGASYALLFCPNIWINNPRQLIMCRMVSSSLIDSAHGFCILQYKMTC